MVKPTIAVDLDEVLGQFVNNLCLFHNEAYGTKLSIEDFSSYTFREVWGGSEEESKDKIDKFFNSSYFPDIPLVPGAVKACQQLCESFDLVLVTSRQSSIELVTRKWIDTHFPNIFSKIMFGNHWGVTGKKVSKSEMCKHCGAIVLIDDSLIYAKECASLNGIKVLLFDYMNSYPWNKANEALPLLVERVQDWDQVLIVLNSL